MTSLIIPKGRQEVHSSKIPGREPVHQDNAGTQYPQRSDMNCVALLIGARPEGQRVRLPDVPDQGSHIQSYEITNDSFSQALRHWNPSTQGLELVSQNRESSCGCASCKSKPRSCRLTCIPQVTHPKSRFRSGLFRDKKSLFVMIASMLHLFPVK